MSWLSEKLADKLVFFSISFILFIQVNTSAIAIGQVLIALLISALASYSDKPALKAACALLFIGLCITFPQLSYFLPLIALDLLATPWPFLTALGAIPLITHVNVLNQTTVFGLALLILLAGHVYRRSESLAVLRAQTYKLRDAAQESKLREDRQHEVLQEKQDYEIHLATLRERNRIAREIHDQVGHQLTSAILQVGAMMTVQQDPALLPELNQLKTTLSISMEQIRNSVHDLHDQSIDLKAEINRIADDFDYCPLRVEYDLTGLPPPPVRYAFLAIIKEGLANIMRHSQAGKAYLTLREHPGFYQLILRDNGRGCPDLLKGGSTLPQSAGTGMGLRNIVERVASLGGQTHFKQNEGFTIFVTIPRAAYQEAKKQ